MADNSTARIRNIIFYPVKSAAGLEVEQATLTPGGLEVETYKDHEYMIVRGQPNASGVHEFVTQRDKRHKGDRTQGFSVLSQIRPALEHGRLVLTWRHTDGIEVPQTGGEELSVQVWDHVGTAIDQGDEISQWLTYQLRSPLRLVKAAGSFSRLSNQKYMANTNPLQFQDGYPVHWFPIESVLELSARAGRVIPWQSFRPQVVIEGMRAQYEHEIYAGTLAGVPFIDPKPCDRCPVTLVDQETGRIRPKEPLRTLSQYMRWTNPKGESKIIFGENMLPQGRGVIAVGDEMLVDRLREPRLVYGP